MIAKEFKTKVLPISKKLLAYAMYFTKDEELARDVVQDIFLKLWQKKDSLYKVENIEAFAMRMTRNRCLDVIRNKRTTGIDKETERKLEAQTYDVHKKVELSETAHQIKMLIKNLPDLQRKIMQMRDIEQFSYNEIAELTQLTVNAIRVNLSRARKKVRDEFLKLNENEGNQRNTASSASLF
jgi:RNA polymerase sigma-70 factor (ECF subfamily)